MIELGVKGGLIVLVAGIVALLVRRAPASVRHLVWVAAFLGLALMPLVQDHAPSWSLAPRKQVVIAIPSTADLGDVPDLPALAPVPEQPVFGESQAWLLGSCAVALYALIGLFVALALRYGAKPFGDLPGFARLTRSVGIRRSVRALVSGSRRVRTAVTWGAWRPTVLLPASSGAWAPETTNSVLTHELAHVRRFDWLVQLFALIVCAGYWFCPLVWLAYWLLRREAESAADDVVIAQGRPASAYADDLLSVARALQRGRAFPLPGVSLMKTSRIEKRISGILNPRAARRGVTRAEVLAVVLAAISIVVPVATASASPSPDDILLTPTVEPLLTAQTSQKPHHVAKKVHASRHVRRHASSLRAERRELAAEKAELDSERAAIRKEAAQLRGEASKLSAGEAAALQQQLAQLKGELSRQDAARKEAMEDVERANATRRRAIADANGDQQRADVARQLDDANAKMALDRALELKELGQESADIAAKRADEAKALSEHGAELVQKLAQEQVELAKQRTDMTKRLYEVGVVSKDKLLAEQGHMDDLKAKLLAEQARSGSADVAAQADLARERMDLAKLQKDMMQKLYEQGAVSKDKLLAEQGHMADLKAKLLAEQARSGSADMAAQADLARERMDLAKQQKDTMQKLYEEGIVSKDKLLAEQDQMAAVKEKLLAEQALRDRIDRKGLDQSRAQQAQAYHRAEKSILAQIKAAKASYEKLERMHKQGAASSKVVNREKWILEALKATLKRLQDTTKGQR